ncbi:lipoyl(octanoyl) transferase LipB [Azospirillum brasilense]|uniref:lipoyl(octanoyl) transferase LipB n=1 Tax=Azospirillum brasilense TaxID=192 RepID=UPI000E694D26|nr:lipoyl(octanoyl) transferase LipB [Azospirillum brasilense]NUB26018.1 lipoyl(octanoyl) transferase LipB [Azospirillum brasilense]NUB33268.1 lipoyl(octanoyl) transferase LipB [Azospirillum brasilense]RIW02909.1 lipoyl(octanoyl) transferase LipB [Azospirillum brasilense]
MTDLTAPVPPFADARDDAVPAAAPARAVEWRISDTPVPYPDALAEMEARVEAIRAGTAPELVWLLEHPPLYTAGTSAREEDLLEPGRFPVYQAGRGGQFTYHGPGQRVAYVMLDLKTRGADIRAFVQDLEEWLIRTLAAFNIRGERREGRVGIWVDKQPYGGAPGQEDKIAAIGVRVRRWVSFHGVALNVEPDLSHFAGIVPCGISEHGVTSIVALGHLVAMEDVDAALIASFGEVFGGGSEGE